MIRPLALLLLLLHPAAAAEVAGVTFPPTRAALGTTLHLNGAGARLYSVFRIPVYAAALYLEHPAHDPAAILAAPQRKLLEVHALRAVSADDIRAAWRASLIANCPTPCQLPPGTEAFLAATPPSQIGTVETYLFDPTGLHILRNAQPAGAYPPAFATLLLATFIGPSPPTEALKRDLLGQSP